MIQPHELPPVHPGEVLLKEFLEPMGISQYRLAKDSSVPPRRINEIVHGKRAVTADTALRLGRFFGTTARFWLELQVQHDLELETEKLGDRLAREVRPWNDPPPEPFRPSASAGSRKDVPPPTPRGRRATG